MKNKIIIFFIILIVILIGMLPFLDGYFFKKIYYQHIAFCQKQMDKNIKIKIESYELGWMKSIANVSIIRVADSSRDFYSLQPIVFHVKSIIHHGPFIFIDHKLKLASAYIKTYIYLPDILKIFLAQNEKGFMQIYSQVTLDGNTWKNHYFIPPISFNQFGNWDGLVGNVTVTTIKGQPVKIQNTMTFGKLFVPLLLSRVPEITINPIDIEGMVTQKTRSIWDGNSKLKSLGIMAKWQDGNFFNLNNFLFASYYRTHDNFYDYDIKFSIDRLQLPPSSPISNFSNVIYTLSFKDLNINGLLNLNKYFHSRDDDLNQQPDLILKTLSPSTTVTMKLDMTTELGKAFTALIISLKSLPPNAHEIGHYLNIDLNVQATQALVEKALASYLAYELTDSSLAVQAGSIPSDQKKADPIQAKIILDDLIQKGYLIKDKDNYILSFSKKGLEIILNGKAISESDLNTIWSSINQNKNVPAPQPTLPIPVVSPVIHSSNTSGYHCYWMENSSGKYQWILQPTYSKSQCFALDSCNGGMRQSGGGCYKWAAAPDAKAEPWDIKP